MRLASGIQVAFAVSFWQLLKTELEGYLYNLWKKTILVLFPSCHRESAKLKRKTNLFERGILVPGFSATLSCKSKDLIIKTGERYFAQAIFLSVTKPNIH